MDKYMTSAGAAYLLGVSRKTIKKWCALWNVQRMGRVFMIDAKVYRRLEVQLEKTRTR